MTIQKKCREMVKWLAQESAAVSALENELKERKERLERGRRRIHEVLNEMGHETVKLEEGVIIENRTIVRYAKKPEVTNEMLFTWLRQNGLGDAIKPTVNSSTLSKTLRIHCERGHCLDTNLFSSVEKKTVKVYGMENLNPTHESEKPHQE